MVYSSSICSGSACMHQDQSNVGSVQSTCNRPKPDCTAQICWTACLSSNMTGLCPALFFIAVASPAAAIHFRCCILVMQDTLLGIVTWTLHAQLLWPSAMDSQASRQRLLVSCAGQATKNSGSDMPKPDYHHLPNPSGPTPASRQNSKVAQQDCQAHLAQPTKGKLWLP